MRVRYLKCIDTIGKQGINRVTVLLRLSDLSGPFMQRVAFLFCCWTAHLYYPNLRGSELFFYSKDLQKIYTRFTV